MNEAATWRGRIWRSSGAAVFQGQGGSTNAHTHPAYKLVLGAQVDGPMNREGRCLVVPPGVAHLVSAAGEVTLVYLDARVYDASTAQRLGHQLRLAAGPSDFEALCDDVHRLPTTAHESELATLLSLFIAGARRGDVARCSGRSTSSFTHRVSERTGASPRFWRTWSRVLLAVDAIGRGLTVTDAAHEADFSDGPHLWRVCRSPLGISPSTLAGCHFVFDR
ncbi:MAG: AraC family transcriptional regulator [Myxococcaceae bacterium]|nr:AraC family transcriptional regulator [Myxococcaceae bacterium]